MEASMISNGQKFSAEFIGTFFLVFIGTGAIAADSFSGGAVGLVGIALAFGLAIALMVGATARISGGHINPAVTFGMLITGNIKPKEAGVYLAAQLLGATFASFLLSKLSPNVQQTAGNMGVTLPAAGVGVGSLVGIEIVLTFLLVFVIFSVAVDTESPFKSSANFMIGLTVTICALMGGTITGASMNPARSFGPALLTGEWTLHWAYWIAPLLGGALAATVYTKLFLSKEINHEN